ncbi:hypothetical protein ACIRPX_14325 [Streptomyces sp. NPDC101225]|uniref:hypothetical protein n=1 Tax=Streptomyces sp. NPDC101225 TaxID=3366135 RepID=UPI0038082276
MAPEPRVHADVRDLSQVTPDLGPEAVAQAAGAFEAGGTPFCVASQAEHVVPVHAGVARTP